MNYHLLTRTYRGFGDNFKMLIVAVISFSVTMLAMIPIANQHHKSLTLTAVSQIESELLSSIDQLSYLLEDDFYEQSCDHLIYELRSSIFSLGMAKEAATFDANGKVRCTSSERAPSFHIYKTILARLAESESHVTLSYTRSALIPDKTLILLFSRYNGRGVSVLYPKEYLIEMVEDIFSFGDMDYRIDVIGRTVKSAKGKEPIRIEEIESSVFPLKVFSCVGINFYFTYLLSKLWIGLLAMTFCMLAYLMYSARKVEQNSLEFSLAKAIKNKNLTVHFQPIVDQRDNKVIGGESLVRWIDPVQGFISPGIFIPLAEKVGLIDKITYLVLERAALLIEKNKSHFQDRYISVNISRSLILRADFINEIEARLRFRHFICERLVFEITEEAIFSESELSTLKKHLNSLSQLGIRIAIDDFGTGYSGLDFITQYSFDIIKIDRVFVNNLNDSQTIRPLLESMRTLATTLNMSVVVEGVEEESQLMVLRQLGFYNIQGFYFSKPIPHNKFMTFVEQSDKVADSTKSVNC